MVSNCRAMKAIRVHQFGDPSVMKLEDVPDHVCRRRTGAGRCQSRRRQSRRHLHSQRAIRVRCRRCRTRRARTRRAWLRRWAAMCTTFKAGDRVYISGTVDGRAYGAYAQRARVHDRSGSSSPEPHVVCRRRRRRRPLCHRVACALRQRAGGPGRDGLDPWRKRRRRRRRRADGERRRIARVRHRRNRTRHGSLRASRARTRSSIIRLPVTRRTSWRRPAGAAST